MRCLRATRRAALVLLIVSLEISRPQTSAGDPTHHPGDAALPAPAGSTSPATEMSRMGGMTSPRSEAAPLYPTLMSLPALTPETRAEVERLATQQITEGMARLRDDSESLTRATQAGDPAAMQQAAGKMRESSEIRFGEGAFEAGLVSRFVNGLAGEAMINFGPLGVPPAFLIYGILLAGLHRFVMGLDPGDARVLLAPFAVLLAIVLLASDLDNALWFTCKVAALPALFVYLGTRHPASFRDMARLAVR